MKLNFEVRKLVISNLIIAKIKHRWMPRYRSGRGFRTFSTYCHCGSNQPFNHEKGVYCCTDTPCMKNKDGNVTCSSGKVLKFREKCAQLCPIARLQNIFLSSLCNDQESCPEGETVSKVCRNEDESIISYNEEISWHTKKCGASFHNPDHLLKQSFKP